MVPALLACQNVVDDGGDLLRERACASASPPSFSSAMPCGLSSRFRR